MTARRILITGAAGFIGSHLAESLAKDGHTVFGVDNFNDYYSPDLKRANWEEISGAGELSLHEIDLRDADAVNQLWRDAEPELLVHLAAQAGVRPSLTDPIYYHDVNITGTLRLLQAAEQKMPERVVFASSSSVYGNCANVPFREDDPTVSPISPYGATKLSGEHHTRIWAELKGVPVLAMRFFTVYGPRQRPDMAIRKFTKWIDTGQEITMFGDGTTYRDYTYVDDILKGLHGALFSDPVEQFRIYNLGESRTVALRELISVVEEAVGKEAKITQMPEQPGDVKRTYADISRAREELGYDPQIPIEEGVRRFVEWYRQLPEAARNA